MSGDRDINSHPARKVDPSELKRRVAEKNRTVPAVTRRMMALEFPDPEPATIGNNLDDLVDEGELCRFNDGDVKLWWYPRENDDAGTVPYEEFVDDSVDYSKVEPEEVPRDLAEEIASEKLPYYNPGSLWADIAGATQLGIFLALGLVIVGLGRIVSGSFGLTQRTAATVLQTGIYVALASTAIYTISSLLDLLASTERVNPDPYPELRQKFN